MWQCLLRSRVPLKQYSFFSSHKCLLSLRAWASAYWLNQTHNRVLRVLNGWQTLQTRHSPSRIGYSLWSSLYSCSSLCFLPEWWCSERGLKVKMDKWGAELEVVRGFIIVANVRSSPIENIASMISLYLLNKDIKAPESDWNSEQQCLGCCCQDCYSQDLLVLPCLVLADQHKDL